MVLNSAGSKPLTAYSELGHPTCCALFRSLCVFHEHGVCPGSVTELEASLLPSLPPISIVIVGHPSDDVISFETNVDLVMSIELYRSHCVA